MKARFLYSQVEPESVRVMRELQSYVDRSGLDPKLLELIKIRASQINGCAYCLDMHTKDARAQGETEERIHLLSAWREAPFYSDGERAALEFTEALTLIATQRVSNDLYERLRVHFTAAQYVQLIMAINVINNWNRLAIATGAVAGTYRPEPLKT